MPDVSNEPLHAALAGITCETSFYAFSDEIEFSSSFIEIAASFKGIGLRSSGEFREIPINTHFSSFCDYQLKFPSFYRSFITDKSLDVFEVFVLLLRLKTSLRCHIAAHCSMSFEDALKTPDHHSLVQTYEIPNDQLLQYDPRNRHLSVADLQWIDAHWKTVLRLYQESNNFQTAVQVYNSVRQRQNVAILTIWGALEGLFLSGMSGEITQKIASYIACYMRPAGKLRLDLYKEIKALYKIRSQIAHEGKTIDNSESFTKSLLLFTEVLMKIIEDSRIPTLDHLNNLLFGF